VAFKNGKRVSLKEAGAKLTRPESLKENPVSGIDKNDVRYRVQLGTFAGNVPSDVMGKFIEIGNVTSVSGTEDTRYFYGSFKSKTEASDALRAIQKKEFADAFLVGDLKGRIITVDDADQILAP
jgi:cell division protein FtsN